MYYTLSTIYRKVADADVDNFNDDIKNISEVFLSFPFFVLRRISSLQGH